MKRIASRDIGLSKERELWARAAGRCQFNGCNKLLYKSSVTQESINKSQKAHIYSFGKGGPRGQGPYTAKPEAINELSNLMLVCHECHQTIDPSGQVEKYPADLLLAWKDEHERRVEITTGIASDMKSHVVLYGANIGQENSPLDFTQCCSAMLPERYPSDNKPQILSMQAEHRDHVNEYWTFESSNLRARFQRIIQPLIEQDPCKQFSLFALAPQPLLVLLGTLFTDKIEVAVFQRQREPEPSWSWSKNAFQEPEFLIHHPNASAHAPVLIIALSGHIDEQRITAVLGEQVSIWTLTIQTPHNDFLKTKNQLSAFRRKLRTLMVSIKQQHPSAKLLHVFPAMPIACAIEMGRIRMPKADLPWTIYDQSNVQQRFIEAITIGANENATNQI